MDEKQCIEVAEKQREDWPTEGKRDNCRDDLKAYRAATLGVALPPSNARQRKRRVHFLQVYHDEARRHRVQVLHLQQT